MRIVCHQARDSHTGKCVRASFDFNLIVHACRFVNAIAIVMPRDTTPLHKNRSKNG
jgi:hypothetical protein